MFVEFQPVTAGCIWLVSQMLAISGLDFSLAEHIQWQLWMVTHKPLRTLAISAGMTDHVSAFESTALSVGSLGLTHSAGCLVSSNAVQPTRITTNCEPDEAVQPNKGIGELRCMSSS